MVERFRVTERARRANLLMPALTDIHTRGHWICKQQTKVNVHYFTVFIMTFVICEWLVVTYICLEITRTKVCRRVSPYLARFRPRWAV